MEALKRPLRIELCGGIASGKTTLATALVESGQGSLVHENFEANPFFEKFYQTPSRYAFETELTFLLQHYSGIRDGLTNELVVDYSLALDLAYSFVTLTPRERRAFGAVFDQVLDVIRPPDVLVRLDCPTEVKLDRIHARGRSSEQKISAAYLEGIEQAIEGALSLPIFSETRILRISSTNNDFRVGAPDRQKICKLVRCFASMELPDKTIAARPH